MARRKLLAIGFALGSLLGLGLWRRRGREHDRVDLYLENGQMVSLEAEAKLLAHTRDALQAGRQ